MRTVVAVVAFAILLSGCLGASDPEPPSGATAPVVPTIAERLASERATLPCAADFEYGKTSPVFKEVFHMETEGVRYGEADAIDGSNLVVFARYGTGGFDILDVTDPYAPVHIAAFPIDSYSFDIKASSDGKTLYIGGIGTIDIVDITEPSAPVATRTVSYPEPLKTGMVQAHMLHVANISGTDYLFSATGSQLGVLIYKAVGGPGDIDLELVTVFAPLIGGPLSPHDMMVQHDPVLDIPILWVANGFGGIVAADVSDPSLPKIVSFDPEKDPYRGYTHTVSVVHYDDKRYAVTVAEVGSNVLKLYDATELALPVLIATWTIFPTTTSPQHNTQVMGDWLWLGHYDEGVLLFDLRAEIADLTLAAYNLDAVPNTDPLDPFARYIPSAGSTWESIVVNGVHWTTSGGIYGTLNGCFAAGDDTLDAYV